jgi:hypothetical protein
LLNEKKTYLEKIKLHAMFSKFQSLAKNTRFSLQVKDEMITNFEFSSAAKLIMPSHSGSSTKAAISSAKQ